MAAAAELHGDYNSDPDKVDDYHRDKNNGPRYSDSDDEEALTPPEFKEYNARARAAREESPFYRQALGVIVLEGQAPKA